MPIRSVGFRMETEGKAEVKNDFKEVQTAAEAAMAGVAEAAEQSAERADRATEAYTKRQIDSFQRQAQAAKLAAAQAGARSAFDDAASRTGNGSQFATVNFDRSVGGAKASASIFSEAFARDDQQAADAAKATAAAEALAARVEDERAASLAKLRAAIDPVSVAQARYGADVAAADALLKAGSITVTEHGAALDLYAKRLESVRQGLDGEVQADAAATAAAERLRAQIDPLGAAQARYDQELKSHAELLTRGKITESEHAAAVTISGNALAQAKRELGEHTNALSLNRSQMIIGQSAVMRFTDSVIAGQSPIRALALEAHKLGEVVSFDDGGVAGGLAKVRALLNPTTAAIAAATAVVVVGTASWADYASSIKKLNALAGGAGHLTGVSGDQLEQDAEAAARAGNITVAAARDIETAYVQTGKIGGNVLTGLTAVTNDFAAATGQKLDQAKSALADAFADPAKGADELTARYGLLDAKTLEYVHRLVEQGDEEKAQAILLKAVQSGFDGAAAHAKLFGDVFGYIKSSATSAFAAVGHLIDLMVTGGTAAERLASLQSHRSRLLSDSYGLADTSDVDKQIAAVQAELRKASDDKARSRAVDGMKVVNAYTGADERAEAFTKLTAARSVLVPAAGANASQIKAATEATDAYTHAVQSWIPAGQKAAEIDAARTAVAAAQTGPEKAAAARQLVLAQAHGEVVTKAALAARANEAAAQATDKAGHAGAAHAATLAREAVSMEVNAAEALKVAAAYGVSTAAGLEAEARRKAATDATKKGIDVEAQARRQLNLQVAEAVAAGGKTVAGLSDETAARKQILDQVEAGTLSVGEMGRALSDEAALRPLITLRTIAQGSALDALNKMIADYRSALEQAHKEEDRSTFEKKMQDSIDKAEEYKATIVDLAHTPLDRALNAAARAAGYEADAAGWKPGDPHRLALVQQRTGEAGAKFDTDRKRSVQDTLVGQEDSLALSQRELELAGANDNLRTTELEKLKLSIAYRRAYGDEGAADLARELAGVDAQERLNAQLKLSSAAWSEIRGFGTDFVDTVLSADTWSSWGNAGKTILKEIEGEFLKLVAINPLKNLINGNSALPTLSSIGGLFGGSYAKDVASLTASSNSFLSNFSVSAHNATGTESWTGGMTWVNENGPEIADLPNGTRIYPAAETRRMLASGGGGDTHNHYYIEGNLLTPEFWGQIQSMNDNAAARGAAGGAQLSAANAAKRARTRIPGR